MQQRIIPEMDKPFILLFPLDIFYVFFMLPGCVGLGTQIQIANE
jgi:hypothetical protein